jgi:hypothetical protein
MEDEEANRFSARAARYARVGANVGGVAARIAAAPVFSVEAVPRAAMRRPWRRRSSSLFPGRNKD